MTVTPAEPTPTPTEPPAAATTPPAPTTTPPAPTEPPKAADVAPTSNPWDSPEAAKAEIERLRKEAGASRVNAKAQAADDARKELAQQIGKAIGLVEEVTDPAKLTEQLTASQADAQRARVELAVFRAASGANGDPAALLDSTSFLRSLDGVDPNDTAAVQAAITSAVTANPRLGLSSDPRPPAPNPAQGSSASGSTAVAQLTRADVERMAREGKHAEIEQARKDGKLDDLLSGKSK